MWDLQPRGSLLFANSWRRWRQIVDAVVAARGKGLSWQRIGDILGTSAQAAQQRYGSAVDAV